jgi:hypothetical protein
MSYTSTVSGTQLAGANTGQAVQPGCPACRGGRLEPHYVQIRLARPPERVEGANYLDGWVAVCTGDPPGGVAPCGFTLPMTAHRYGR